MGPLSLSRANPGLVLFLIPIGKSPHLGKQGEEWLRTSAAPASFSEFTRQKNTKQLGKPAKKLGFFLILSAKNEGWKKKTLRGKTGLSNKNVILTRKKRKLTRRSGVLTKNNWDFTWFNQSFCGLQKNFGHVISKSKDEKTCIRG